LATSAPQQAGTSRYTSTGSVHPAGSLIGDSRCRTMRYSQRF